MKHSFFLFAIASAVGICASVEAHAITLPDSGSCSSGGGAACLSITNSSAGAGVAGNTTHSGGYGLSGVATSGIGVGASSQSGYGFYANSNTGIAVYGYSASSNGVVGQNTRTDWNAAVISAIPGNSNGLAIWAGGGAVKPGGGSWTASSDARLKKDVKDFRAGLAELKRLRPVSYQYNGLGKTQDDGNVFVGVIAQELEKVLPSMVKSSKGKLRPGDGKETDLKYVDPSAFTYVLINAVQEQQKIIERQEARIAKLERGDAPLVAYGSLGGGLAALGLVPLGLIAVRRRRKESSGAQE